MGGKGFEGFGANVGKWALLLWASWSHAQVGPKGLFSCHMVL